MATKKYLDLTGLSTFKSNIENEIPTKTSDLTNDSGFVDSSYHDSSKQDALVSGTNIKTINNQSLLGGGNITVGGGGLSFDDIYPVGSIYMSVNNTSPATLFGGTWQQIKDTFLLACGDTYSNGVTGGEATHTLTTDEMPSHTHGNKALSGKITIRAIDSVSSNNANLLQGASGIVSRSNNADVSGYRSANANYRTAQSNQYNQITVDASHEHGSNGGGLAHNNMPPYLAVYMWKRTA